LNLKAFSAIDDTSSSTILSAVFERFCQEVKCIFKEYYLKAIGECFILKGAIDLKAIHLFLYCLITYYK